MKTIKKILMLVLIVVLITGGCSAIEDSKVSSTTESTIADNLLEYKWIDSLGEHTVYIALDEVAIIPSDTQLGPVEIDSLVKKFDDKAVIIKKNDPVIFVKMSSFFSLKDLENKTSNFKKGTGNKANLAFYDSPIKDERPGAITGEIFVSFDKKMDKNSIKAWAKNENLDLIKSFEFSQNTYLFDAGADIISLEITNRIFKSDTIIYAYPNLWKSIEYKSVPNDLLFPNQWHLRNTGQGGGTPGEDVKIETVWDSFKGSPNEVIAIVDDGLEIGHVDLAPNIIPGLSWDYVDNNMVHLWLE